MPALTSTCLLSHQAVKFRPRWAAVQEEDDAGFAGAVVQALNLILLTSSQLQVGGRPVGLAEQHIKPPLRRQLGMRQPHAVVPLAGARTRQLSLPATPATRPPGAAGGAAEQPAVV